MPSEMFERGRRDAAADALDDNYYAYYYDYKRGYDEVARKRRRTQQQRMARRVARWALIAIPIVLVVVGLGYMFTQSQRNRTEASIAETPTITPTLRPTLPPPTEEIVVTPTPEPGLRPQAFAVVSNTQGGRLRARQTPGTTNKNDDDIVARFPEGEVVQILEGPQVADEMDWWLIEGQSGKGWASAAFLQPVPPPQ